MQKKRLVYKAQQVQPAIKHLVNMQYILYNRAVININVITQSAFIAVWELSLYLKKNKQKQSNSHKQAVEIIVTTVTKLRDHEITYLKGNTCWSRDSLPTSRLGLGLGG